MITIGTKVAIMPGEDYGNRFAGYVGIVRKNSLKFDKVGVQVEGCKNSNSEYGVFWFDERCLAVMPDNVLSDDAIRQIIWTCRVGQMLEQAIEWCAQYRLKFDAINQNLPDIIEVFGGDTRKIFANYYIDDRNFWYDDKSPKKILYVCDEKKCANCSDECIYTSDIDHAKNFNKEYGVYIEED